MGWVASVGWWVRWRKMEIYQCFGENSVASVAPLSSLLLGHFSCCSSEVGVTDIIHCYWQSTSSITGNRICWAQSGVDNGALYIWWNNYLRIAGLTVARILFPQCQRAKVVPFKWHKVCQDGRWRIVCAVSCHLSRISYELVTKCVPPTVTHIYLTISSWQVVTPLKFFFEHFKIFPKT